jgi:hypothetical protein
VFASALHADPREPVGREPRTEPNVATGKNAGVSSTPWA